MSDAKDQTVLGGAQSQPDKPDTASFAPLEGRLDGKYEVLAQLGEGGMGAIYEVRHRLLDEVRVVKVLHPRHESQDELRERFLREARAAIRLRHPNVVQIHDFSMDDEGVGLIVMESIRGVDLRRLIRKHRKPSLALGLDIARQGLRALAYLHRHRFVHRDISPDNLMLTLDVDGKPLVKLIDLGITKHPADTAPAITVDGSFLGKFRYASPEHFQSGGAEALGPSSDLYSFGLVLYELLTGQFPLDGSSTSELVRAHLFGSARPFAETDPGGEIPEEVRAPILRALQKDPVDRYPSADAFLSDLEALQELFPLDDLAIAEARTWVLEAREAQIQKRPIQSDSFQDRLDRNFGFEPTPTPPPAAGTVVDDELLRTASLRAGTPQGTPASAAAGSAGPASSHASGEAVRPDAPARQDPDPGGGAGEGAAAARSAPGAAARDLPEDFDDLFARATKAVLLRDYAVAVELFERARTLRPDDARVLYNLERLKSR